MVSMSKSNVFLVYIHRRQSDGAVFYVGKGKVGRHARKCDRSDWWWRVVRKHGYRIEIVKDNLTNDEAISLERWLIANYGRRDLGLGNLVNMTDGGEGVDNPPARVRRAQAYAQANKDIHTFYHHEHGRFVGTRYELVNRFGLSKTDRRNISDMVRIGRYSHVKGWRVEGNEFTPKGPYRPSVKDIDIYTLYNEEESRIYCGGRHLFCDLFNVASPNFTALKSGSVNKCRGWRMLRSG